jgi:hypothetical protein
MNSIKSFLAFTFLITQTTLAQDRPPGAVPIPQLKPGDSSIYCILSVEMAFFSRAYEFYILQQNLNDPVRGGKDTLDLYGRKLDERYKDVRKEVNEAAKDVCEAAQKAVVDALKDRKLPVIPETPEKK